MLKKAATMDCSRPNARVRRCGASAVELAVILPVFLMLVMGIIEFGRAMMVSQLVTNGARHGARLSVLDGSDNAAVRNSIETFLVDAVGIEPGDADIKIEITPGPGNSDPAGELALATAKDLVTIKVSVPYEKIGYVTGSYLSGTQLIGQCTMRHE
jgi:Flp pilus assembly protein TadG